MAEKAVVVGAGAISGAWFPPLIEEGIEIPAVVDLNLDAAKAQIAAHGLDAQPSTDLLSTLRHARPDFVLDLTVPEAHCQVTCTALQAGCHVLGEKPMASNMEDAHLMVRTAEQTGKLYMINQVRRWDPLPEAARRALVSGTVGAVSTINCDFFIGAHFGGFRDEMDSPLLLDMAIHHFDLARFIAGVDPLAVYAKEFNPKGSWYRGDVSAACVFEMTDGAVFTYRGSWCAEGFHTSWSGDWRIIGERGTLLYEHDQQPRAQVVAGDDGFHRPLQDVEIPPVSLAPIHFHGALREMLAFLRTGEQPQTECHDNIKSLAMVFAAIESSRRGERITISAN